jgi:hypothetical protein
MLCLVVVIGVRRPPRSRPAHLISQAKFLAHTARRPWVLLWSTTTTHKAPWPLCFHAKFVLISNARWLICHHHYATATALCWQCSMLMCNVWSR